MHRYLIIIYIIFNLAACGSDSRQDQSSHAAHSDTTHAHHGNPMEAELMAIHDSVMLKAGELMVLKKQIEGKVNAWDSLPPAQTHNQPDLRKSQAQSLIEKLDQADKSMMEWMHQYKSDTLKQLSASAQETYVSDQKSKIEVVRSRMLDAIAESKKFIQNQAL